MGKVLRITLVFLSSIFLSCSDSQSDPPKAADPMSSHKLSPFLEVSKFARDGCLNLELLSTYFNDSGFEYPARSVTYNYSSDKDANALFVRNFGVRDFQLTQFPILKNVRQEDCQQLTAETAYGRTITYRIVEFTPDSIHLEPELADEVEAEKALVEAYSSEPSFRRLQMHLASPTHFVFDIEAQMLRSRCNTKSSFIYKKTTVYRWSPSVAELPLDEEISQQAYDKVRDIVRPDRTPEIPTPVANEESEEVHPSETSLRLPVEGLRQIQLILPVIPLERSCG